MAKEIKDQTNDNNNTDSAKKDAKINAIRLAFPTPSVKNECTGISYGTGSSGMSVFITDGSRELNVTQANIVRFFGDMNNNANIRKLNFMTIFNDKYSINTGINAGWFGAKYVKVKLSKSTKGPFHSENGKEDENPKVMFVQAYFENAQNNPNEFVFLDNASFAILVDVDMFRDAMNRIHRGRGDIKFDDAGEGYDDF